jgi:hypothetical protein
MTIEKAGRAKKNLLLKTKQCEECESLVGCMKTTFVEICNFTIYLLKGK